jgi:hypothetical protein
MVIFLSLFLYILSLYRADATDRVCIQLRGSLHVARGSIVATEHKAVCRRPIGSGGPVVSGRTLFDGRAVRATVAGVGYAESFSGFAGFWREGSSTRDC